MKKLIKWLDNYWYHYKWPTVIITLLAVIIVIMVTQFAVRESYDVSVLYAGPLQASANQTRDAESELAKLIKDDVNGDKKKNCQITSFFLLTDEQIKAIEAEYDEKDEMGFVNRSQISTTRQQFTNQVSAGDASVCLLDPYWYELLKSQELLVPLSEALDRVPEYAADEYSVRFSDTGFASYFTALQIFPADTVLCLRRLPAASAFVGGSSADEQYEASVSLFRAIIEFSTQK